MISKVVIAWLLFICELSLWGVFKYFCFLVYSVILAEKHKNMGIYVNIASQETEREQYGRHTSYLMKKIWDIQVIFSKAS